MSNTDLTNSPQRDPDSVAASPSPQQTASLPARETSIQEINGPKGPEPTRFGDWERKGRCVDF